MTLEIDPFEYPSPPWEQKRETGKHTPGPWSAITWADSGKIHGDIAAEVSLACPGTGGAMSYTNTVCKLSWTGGEHDANGRLIAAAPEMFDALEMIVAGTSDQEPPFRAMGASQMRDVALKALMKAKGVS